ncbi:MarR family winged helix-turn-helix transcriptional regulator [Actinoplanes derwentensis]|nr:MarR family transcriptional regulator [Actinoplanes derwentensis]
MVARQGGVRFVDAGEEIGSARQAADDALVVTFGRLLGVANRLEHLVGRALEQECGISHLMYEVLLILGRADAPGLAMSAIGRAQVLTTGGVTRLIDRMEAADLVQRADDPGDRRGRLVRLTPRGEETVVRATRLHRENLQRLLASQLPAERWDAFTEDLRMLSRGVGEQVPRLR